MSKDTPRCNCPSPFQDREPQVNNQIRYARLMLAGDNEAVLNLRYTRTLPSKDVPGVQMRKEVLLHPGTHKEGLIELGQ